MPTSLVGVCDLEEARGQVWKPLRVDCHHLAHVLLACQDQLVVYHPLWLVVEQTAGRVDEHRLLFYLHISIFVLGRPVNQSFLILNKNIYRINVSQEHVM